MTMINKTGTAILSLSLFVLCSLFVSPCLGQNQGSETENTQGNQAYSAVPAEKQEQWQSIQNVARKDYEVCLEHCAENAECVARCERAYTRRLEMEYNNLTQ
jgi:hypothetical protein